MTDQVNKDELEETMAWVKGTRAHHRTRALEASQAGEMEARRILAEEFEADDMQPVADMIRAGGDAHGYAGTALRAMMRFAAIRALAGKDAHD